MNVDSNPAMASPQSTSTDPLTPLRTVLLRHTEVDGNWHLDWMIERAGLGERRLLTFRVLDRIDLQDCQGFEAERIGDHRAIYLEYEGDLSGGRGTVARVAAGRVRELSEGATFRVEANFGSCWRRYSGRPAAASRWLFEAVAC